MSLPFTERGILLLEDFLRGHFVAKRSDLPEPAIAVLSSAEYSLFTGGKRFRPQLCYAAVHAVDCPLDRVTAFAAAVEMVHTYSLIHDDLPCMDDDSVRRGKPTNHIAFGEATALLAGDALLTEAFAVIAQNYAHAPEIGLKLSLLLSRAAGASGMIAGQQMDMTIEGVMPTVEALMRMHELKTGALIQVCLEGAAVIARATEAQRTALREYGAAIGLAFQLADDILDYDPKQPEPSGIPAHMGLATTEKLLSETTARALQVLEGFGSQADELRQLVNINLKRKV